MISSRIVQLLLLVSSMTSQMIGMLPAEKVVSSLPFQVEGIAQKIEGLPKELRYDIYSSALALRENPKYEVYKKFDVGPSAVTGIALNADNTRALTGSKDGVARIWDVENEKLLKELKGHTLPILSVALSANGTLALTGSVDGTAQIWKINTGELLKTLQVGLPVYSVALSANGSTALIGSFDDIGRLYNTNTGELTNELKGHTKAISSVALSADGTLALTGSRDATARVWNALTGELLKTFEVESSVTSVALSTDEAIAVTVTSTSKVLVLDAKSGTLLNTLLPNSRYIYSVALSKDGKRVLVANNNTIQVWNTQPLPGQKETSTPLAVLADHTVPVMAVAFGGADFIASASQDNTVIIWKPYALEPRGPQENVEILRQAYKETFSRPLLRSAIETKQA